MLRSGTTCFNDMYFFPQAAAGAAVRAGMRAMIGMAVLEFPTAYASDADDYIAKGLAARDALRESPGITTCLAPHAPYTVSDRSFTHLLTLAEQLDLRIHLHLHETHDEITQSLASHGCRPLERLRRLGLLGPGLIAVHAVHLEEHEIDLLAVHGASIAHCPTSNLKLASGIAPIARALARGVNVGIGTDGAASNNRLDLLRETSLAALLAKGSSGDAAALPAHRAIELATLGGARALGLEHEIGSIEPGKAADLCAIRFDALELAPCYDPASHLAYAAGREHVTHVWVNGSLRLDNGRHTWIDEEELKNTASLWQTKISPRNPM
jgi:5-methylthioadenosine/S-adenosylhomocysteine deaminase